jgi:hypothetical protein
MLLIVVTGQREVNIKTIRPVLLCLETQTVPIVAVEFPRVLFARGPGDMALVVLADFLAVNSHGRCALGDG